MKKIYVKIYNKVFSKIHFISITVDLEKLIVVGMIFASKPSFYKHNSL